MKSKGKENDLQIKAQEVSRQQDLIILMLQLHFYLLILTARTERSERRSESELRFASLFFPSETYRPPFELLTFFVFSAARTSHVSD